MGFEPTTSAWIPLEPPGFICNCLSYFITARVTFTCILYPQSTHMIFIIYTSCNSHLTCFRRGFIAQSVEHDTGIAEVMGSNPVGACLSYFITSRGTFTSLLYPLIIYTSWDSTVLRTMCIHESLFFTGSSTKRPENWQTGLHLPPCYRVRTNS